MTIEAILFTILILDLISDNFYEEKSPDKNICWYLEKKYAHLSQAYFYPIEETSIVEFLHVLIHKKYLLLIENTYGRKSGLITLLTYLIRYIYHNIFIVYFENKYLVI